jgi:signal transduction histidine kinase
MARMEAVVPTPAQARPARRPSWLVDVVPVVAIVLLGAILDVSAPQGIGRLGPAPSYESSGLGPALLAVAVAAPLLWRRRYPVLIFCVETAVIIGVANDIPYPSMAAALIAAYSVAAYDRRWWVSLGAVLVAGAIVVVVFPGPLPPIPDVMGPFVLLGVPWLAGNGVRLRQGRLDAVERRASQLERERDDAERALREERARIARELHDVVAHSVSVMVVQAGAARQVVRSKPDRATEALLAVEESGREALGELRHLLGLLTDQGDSPLAPQPGLDGLPALVDRIRSAGLKVTLRVEGEPRRLPPGVDLAGYRVAQEALTNALKHAGGAPTEVVIAYAEDEVRVAVLDDGPPAAGAQPGGGAVGSRQGLVGMRERVGLYGGSLDVGPRPGGGYAVRARLPLAAP